MAADVCTGPDTFSLTLRTFVGDARSHRLGRCTFVPPGRVLGAQDGCILSLSGPEWHFAFQPVAGTRPTDVLPVLSFWYVGAGRCVLHSNGWLPCGASEWHMDGLEALEPITWNSSGWFQGTRTWQGPSQAFAHAPRVGGLRIRPFFLDDQRAPDCELFFAFRPTYAQATSGWRKEGDAWLLTLLWEDIYSNGCADWPPPNQALPPLEYCYDRCRDIALYSPTPTCQE